MLWLNRVGGVLVIAFGLTTRGLIKVPALEREFAIKTDFARGMRYFGLVLVGATFAVGWVPCVGPILGAIWSWLGPLDRQSRVPCSPLPTPWG